jgi:BlaI family transcriptional regulator, penicillinase repressor
MARSKQAGKSNLSKTVPEMTEAEWPIMKVVWAKAPCAAGTVQETLQKDKNWAYSTVKTVMDRMVNKGFLKTYNVRNVQLFISNITENQAKRNEVFKTLKRAFDGALTPMMQFLLEHETFRAEELKQLRQIVDKASGSKN